MKKEQATKMHMLYNTNYVCGGEREERGVREGERTKGIRRKYIQIFITCQNFNLYASNMHFITS